jgi:outer membrane beta-barrel protein
METAGYPESMRSPFPALILFTLASTPALAAEAAPPVRTEPAPQRLEVDALKQKYWAKGNEADLEVVQNRMYTKQYKLNIGLMAGSVAGDPFLNSKAYGGTLGFNFTESLGVNALYWRLSSSYSSAYDAFVELSGYGSNSNPLHSLLGGELSWGILYGKLSLLGKAILHFDLFLYGGAGQIKTQNNSSLAPWVGIGQQLYITRWLTFRVDYRYIRYNEDIIELYGTADVPKGTLRQTRSTSASALTFGVNFLLF